MFRVLLTPIVACMANKENLRREIRVQPVKGRKTQEENANDLFRLRGVNLKTFPWKIYL